ncbi:hypothetical protein D3C87_257220 [compost metagenome]
MKKSLLLLLGIVLVAAWEFFSEKPAPASITPAPIPRHGAFQSLQKPDPRSLVAPRDLASAPKKEESQTSSSLPEKRFKHGMNMPRKAPALLLKDLQLGPQIKFGQDTWSLIENYEAQHWDQEKRKDQDYLGAFAIYSHKGAYGENALPLLYNPHSKTYGIVTGQILIQGPHLVKDCDTHEFHGFPVYSCFAHLSLITVTTSSKDVAEIYRTAQGLRKISGVTSVEVEILSHFQEPM